MENEFVTYNQAIKLKELGFDNPCLAYFKNGEFEYCWDEFVKNSEIENVNNELDEYVSAPLKQQTLRWFRENHNFDTTISPVQHNKKYVAIVYSSVVNFSIDEYDNYEEAVSECINKLIEFVK